MVIRANRDRLASSFVDHLAMARPALICAPVIIGPEIICIILLKTVDKAKS
jgi:hypothetical protein